MPESDGGQDEDRFGTSPMNWKVGGEAEPGTLRRCRDMPTARGDGAAGATVQIHADLPGEEGQVHHLHPQLGEGLGWR